MKTLTQKEPIMDNKIGNALKNEPSTLSPTQKKAIDKSITSIQKEGGIPHETVMKETKLRYPNLFKK